MKIALVWHGDRESRQNAKLEAHRLGSTAAAMRAEGLEPVAAVYNDDFADEVREQLLAVDAAQVWVNPVEGGRDRSRLDAMLREVAGAGVLVSAHPEAIQKMGTKRVLYDTREIGWGSDVHLYNSTAELERDLPERLRQGRPRVLKRLRGHGGRGIWKVSPHPGDPALVLARHAARGSTELSMTLEALARTLAPYFADGSPLIDQPYQERIGEGMVRCYLVRDRIEGFGHQAVNALHPDEPMPGQRLYSPPTDPRFRHLKRKMEGEWLTELLGAVRLSSDDLPMLWDADFMLGPKTSAGEDRYVLCEINVSSVLPYPESAMQPLAAAFKHLRRS